MDVKAIENKIAETEVQPCQKAALAFSGGLDSSLCVELLRRRYGAREIVAVTVDVGQGEDEMTNSREKAAALKIDPVFVDCRAEFTEQWLAKAIRANSSYEGYPVSTSMTRQLIAREVARVARERGCDGICEGSSGKGNDQYRMHNVFALFAPGLAVIVPVRDFDLTRGEEEALCRAWGISVTETITGGDDKTMWCRSIASGAIKLNQEIPDEIWMWLVPPEKAPDQPTEVTLDFERGLPVALDGKRLPLSELVPALNVVAGANGVGRLDIFEDGIMSLKSRELYEAPAATVILKAHRDLEQMCLPKEQVLFKNMIDQQWAYMTYHGEWFHPLKGDLDAFIEHSQGAVNGKVVVRLYKGNADIVRREAAKSYYAIGSKYRLLTAEQAGFDQRWCADAARVRGMPYEIIAQREE
jgi:argininosuccinate synthase